jgi:hypothetical protein
LKGIQWDNLDRNEKEREREREREGGGGGRGRGRGHPNSTAPLHRCAVALTQPSPHCTTRLRTPPSQRIRPISAIICARRPPPISISARRPPHQTRGLSPSQQGVTHLHLSAATPASLLRDSEYVPPEETSISANLGHHLSVSAAQCRPPKPRSQCRPPKPRRPPKTSRSSVPMEDCRRTLDSAKGGGGRGRG